jgi:D-serine deaminase-like pyridoxal phosphate-dependent protein
MMPNEIFKKITRPTLLLDVAQAVKNINCMVSKCQAQGKQFRPHFKTHQSAEIGDLYRKARVKTITVSSVSMAGYFASHGWKDITIAFPVNWREINEINTLADHNHLELLVESPETVEFLQKNLRLLTEVWVKIDVGAHRAGLNWQNKEEIISLVNGILHCDKLILRGFLAHDGRTYHARSLDEIKNLYKESGAHLNEVSKWFEESRKSAFGISVGDTPGCWLSDDLGNVDEIRPGNFIFFDVWQYLLGVCSAEEIAVAVACPVVAKHKDRLEVVIYGGAIHLSKEYILKEGVPIYGLVAFPEGERWGLPEKDCYVSSLSQEHGIVKMNEETFKKIHVGDLLFILPIHSCLTADVIGHYLTLDGRRIEMMKKENGVVV